MSAANQYRAVRLALLDDPAFQGLSSSARFTYITLTVLMGPAGIEVRYAEPLAFELAPRTGLSTRKVLACLKELEAAGWIRREGPVLWIVRQLRDDPVLNRNNANHRKSVRNYVKGLPDCALVREFERVHRAAWLGDETEDRADGMGDTIHDGMGDGVGDGIPMVSGMVSRSEDREEDREEDRGAGGAEKRGAEKRGAKTETEKRITFGDGADALPVSATGGAAPEPAPRPAEEQRRRELKAGFLELAKQQGTK